MNQNCSLSCFVQAPGFSQARILAGLKPRVAIRVNWFPSCDCSTRPGEWDFRGGK